MSAARRGRHPGFDHMTEHAGRTVGWRLCTLDASHLAYITSPDAVANVLLDQIEMGRPVHIGRCAAQRRCPVCE
jgi:hypothetical protein